VAQSRSCAVSYRADHAVIKTLIDRFRYPPHGPEELWESVARIIEQKGGVVRIGERVVRIAYAAGRVTCATTQSNEGLHTHEGDHFISTMPLAWST
jgi:protoporphyrinogen oxidase